MHKSVLCFLLALVFTAGTATAQMPPVPTSPAFKRVVVAYNNSDIAAIEKELPGLQKAYPENPFVQFFHALCNDRTGRDVPGALREYSEIIRKWPEATDSYPFRAEIFAEKGMYDRAVADMDKAIAVEGEASPPVWYKQRGDFKASAGNNAEAVEDFQKAISLVPASPDCYRGLANTALAAGRGEVAEATFKNALAGSQKTNGAVRAAYAEFLLNKKEFAASAIQYSAAFATPGFVPNAKDCNAAGTAAYKIKNYPGAIKYFDQGMALDPKDIDMVCNRASVCIDQLDWEGVYKYAQQALAINSNNPLANMLMAVGVKRTNRGDALAAEYEAKANKLEQK